LRTNLKPLPALRTFTRLLGWRNLRRNRHVVPKDEHCLPAGTEIIWYTCGDYDDVILQINGAPSWRAAVYAIRYGICTGWHEFTLATDVQRIGTEAQRLDQWLHRRWFSSRLRRADFRRVHPECASYSWRRLRREGPPYG